MEVLPTRDCEAGYGPGTYLERVTGMSGGKDPFHAPSAALSKMWFLKKNPISVKKAQNLDHMILFKFYWQLVKNVL